MGGLTPHQHRLLSLVAEHQPTRPFDLRRHAPLSRGGLVNTLKKLEARGLLICAEGRYALTLDGAAYLAMHGCRLDFPELPKPVLPEVRFSVYTPPPAPEPVDLEPPEVIFETLRVLYQEHGLTLKEIAKCSGVSATTVRRVLKFLGVPRRRWHVRRVNESWITREEVEHIRWERTQGETLKSISERWMIPMSTVWDIIQERTWPTLPARRHPELEWP